MKNDICRLSLFRRGLFGDVTIHWTTGFSTQSTPSGFTVGRISPSSGVINMVSGMKRANFTVEVNIDVSLRLFKTDSELNTDFALNSKLVLELTFSRFTCPEIAVLLPVLFVDEIRAFSQLKVAQVSQKRNRSKRTSIKNRYFATCKPVNCDAK